jgi:hypothetical protein
MAEWTRMRDQAAQSTQPDQPLTHDSPKSRASAPLAVLALLAGVVGVLVIAGAGVYLLSEWVGSRLGPDGRDTAASGVDPVARPLAPLISVAGFEQLLEALEEETGSTKVIDLTLYPRYAVADVPLPDGKGRTRSLYYDGAIRETSVGTSDDRTLDLRRVDAATLVSLSRKARKAVEDPNQWYLVLRAPDIQGAVIYAYASNEYGEGGYVAARLDGTVVNKVGW